MSAIPEDVSDDGIVNVRRRQGRAVKTRQKILQAALVEFATMGFDGATTRSIADRAEVPHGLVVYHFETKLAVWQAVVENALNDWHERFVAIYDELKDCEPEVILRAHHREFIMSGASRPEHTWLLSHEVSGTSERFQWLLEQIRGHDIDITVDLIQQAQARGRYVAGDPAHLHFLFIGAATRVFALAAEIEHRVGMSPYSHSFLEQHVTLCEALFFRDLPADA